MTDLEMVKACAEAMGIEMHSKSQLARIAAQYDPLHDDAQAMALVKRFELSINGNQEEPRWSACWFDPNGEDEIRTHGHDLNRAIVECVAQMQSA